MSQRDSGYERKERDCYETPEWVTEALLPHLPRQPESVWEPACGSGKMLAVLRRHYCDVYGSDIETGTDFLSQKPRRCDAIITNPPYNIAEKFIAHALNLTNGIVAMLLRTDFDHARGRKYLFGHPAFTKKLVLTKRIRWIEGSTGSPSFNHAWFMWDWKSSKSQPTLAYD